MPYVNKPRPYKKEWQQQKDRDEKDLRATRERARYSMDKNGTDKNGNGKADAREGKDIDHVKPLSKGGTNAPHNGGHIFFGVECKKDMNTSTAATTLADHFEQAAGYAKDLKMPVFLGPVYYPGGANSACLGGHTIKAIAALNIFGGRMNIGTLVYRTGFNPSYNYRNWYLLMRGDYFWEPPKGFNDSRLNYVVTTGSKKERVPLKVWK